MGEYVQCINFTRTDDRFPIEQIHDDVIKWKHFPRYWLFVRGIRQSPVNSPHKGQWRRALMFSLICAWINGWVNNREAGDKRRHRDHYDVIVREICASLTGCKHFIVQRCPKHILTSLWLPCYMPLISGVMIKITQSLRGTFQVVTKVDSWTVIGEQYLYITLKRRNLYGKEMLMDLLFNWLVTIWKDVDKFIDIKGGVVINWRHSQISAFGIFQWPAYGCVVHGFAVVIWSISII